LSTDRATRFDRFTEIITMTGSNSNRSFGVCRQAYTGSTDADHSATVSFVPALWRGEIPPFLEHRRQLRCDTIARRATCIAGLRADAQSIEVEIRECQRLLKIAATMELELVLIRLRSIQRDNAAQIEQHLQQMRSALKGAA